MTEGSLYLTVIFPQPWPPEVEMEIFTRDQDNSRIRLIADTNGRIGFQTRSSETQSEYWFQPIVVEGGGRAVLSIVWSLQDGASLQLNNQEVVMDANVQGEAMVLETKDHPPTSRELIMGAVELRGVNSEAEYLFLATVMDIDRKVQEGTRYSLIRAAGLLRQLFLDSTPLVHVVNRTCRLKIQFETIDYHRQPPLSPDAHLRDLDGSQTPGAATIVHDLDSFLKAPCFMMGGVTATVRDLISACANAKGGVHLGSSRTEEQGSVLDWDQTIRLQGMEPSLLTIGGVCRIALRGLKPLVNAIENSA